jgi:hypothetical protein
MASKTVFVVSLLSALAVWICLVAVPSIHLFNSENRVLFFNLVLAVPYFALGGRAALFWPVASPRTYAPWAVRRADPRSAFHGCGFVCFLLASLFAVFQAWLADESNRGGLLVNSPCGASSCSRVLDTSSVVYNALGFFGNWGTGTQVYSDYIPTTCVYSACSWASGNNRTVPGFNPQPNMTGCFDPSSPCLGPACYAGNRTQDWPNPAIGLAGGMRSCLGVSVVSRVAPCPGVVVSINADATTSLTGRAPCAYCSPYFRSRLAFVEPGTEYCPASVPNQPAAIDNSIWCGAICPQPSEIRTPAAMLKQSVYANCVAVWYILAWAYCEAFAFIRETCLKIKREEHEKAGGGKKSENLPAIS